MSRVKKMQRLYKLFKLICYEIKIQINFKSLQSLYFVEKIVRLGSVVPLLHLTKYGYGRFGKGV